MQYIPQPVSRILLGRLIDRFPLEWIPIPWRRAMFCPTCGSSQGGPAAEPQKELWQEI